MAKKDKKKNLGSVVAVNRKAYHDYEILEKVEGGIELQGTEVKSCRGHQVNLKDNYVQVKNEEVWAHQIHISPYTHGNIANHEPLRPRKILLHKKEIRRLIGKMNQKGLTMVVLKMYWKRNWLKVELGLAKGKKLHDKRQALAKKDTQRQVQRALKDSGY